MYLGITIPPTIRKRGRPKGRDLTVIGLPVKMCKKNCCHFLSCIHQ